MIQMLVPILSVGWLLGTGWGSLHSPVSFRALGVLTLCAVIAISLSNRAYVRALGLFLFALMLGALWADRAEYQDALMQSPWRAATGTQVLEGQLVRKEDRPDSTLLYIQSVVISENTRTPLPGTLRVTATSGTQFTEGARLRLHGRIALPKPREPDASFDAQRFFARQGIVATMTFPRITLLSEGGDSLLTFIRTRLHDRLRRALPEPSAGILSAILLSYDHDLSPELRHAFAASGVAHLIAISGSHIALLAVGIFFLATWCGAPRWIASVLTVILALGFLALVEFPASGVRSLLMVGGVFWAYVAGRRVQGVRILLLAGALMTVANPRLLLGDLGFQLSMLAMWGLLGLYPWLARPFRGWRDPFGLRTMILLTFSAELATAPLVITTFGTLSLVGLFTNLLAIPLFPLLLVTAALTAVAGDIPYLGSFLTPLAFLSAELFRRLAETAAGLPFAQLSLPHLPPGVLLLLYGSLFLAPLLFSPFRQTMLRRGIPEPAETPLASR